MKYIKRICIYLSTLCIAVSALICSINVHAASKSYDFEGYGTQYDPYLITSYEDICRLRDIVDGGNNLKDVYFKQTEDISFPDGEVWNPIGDFSSWFAFGGYYNGNGHTISNIYCEDSYAGLFSVLTGEVRNLGIESGSIIGSYVGGITSHGTDTARVINCYNKADVVADGRAGGIADNCPGIMMFCWNLGSVQGLSNGVTTAGICSYGEARVAYCHDMNTGKLVDDSTFSGSIIDSTVFSKEDAEDIMNQTYEQMWEIYSTGQLSDGSEVSVAINRGNTVFMKWEDGTLVFDQEYEPDLFCLEKEQNKEAFLSVYNSRFAFEGTGVENDPFQISTYKDLSRLRDCVDIGVTYRNYYFEQTTDIYFPDENWEPIGDLGSNLTFQGIYDGNGHCIYNINCNYSHAGLFSYLAGEVRNLGIESGTFTGNYIGSITSHGTDSARIINCYNKAAVIGNNRAGGIADNFPGLILFSWNLGSVSGLNNETITAGISSYGSGDIEYCYSTSGDFVVNQAAYNGTLVGSRIIASGDISNCLQNNYQKFGNFISDKTIGRDEIVFLTPIEQDLVFDTAYVPDEIDKYMIMAHLPEYVLIICGIFFGVIVFVVALKKQRSSERADVRENRVPEIRRRITYKEHIGAVVLTCGIFFVCFHGVMNVLIPKTAAVISDYWEKDENDNTDVLFLGASTMGANIEHGELWQKYGIAGYSFAFSASRMYDCYHQLIEAEKIRHTQLVVIDAVPCTYTVEYGGYDNKIENLLAMKYSLNKLNFVRTAIQPEDRLDYFLSFPIYHDRYDSVAKQDWLYTTADGKDNKGAKWRYYNKSDYLEIKSSKDITSYKGIDEKAEYYFRKIIEYCQGNDIELLVIKTPDARRDKNQPIYNTVETITEEYGISYLDFNLYDEEIGTVVSDFADDHHLFVLGARKCADFLGEYLISHYDLTDHRGDETYASWDRFAANREDLYLRAITDTDDYFTELQRDNKTVAAIPYRVSAERFTEYTEFLDKLEEIQDTIWNDNDMQYGEDYTEALMFGENQVEITADNGRCVLTVNAEKKMTVSSPALILLVYDEITGEIADVVSFAVANGGVKLTHLYSP